MAEKIIAGNWKMNPEWEDAEKLVSSLLLHLDSHTAPAKIILIPPFPYIVPVMQLCSRDHRVNIGAQNCSEHEFGAYTGEVSAGMLKSIGCTHVLIGHSERRQHFGERHEVLAKKAERALSSSLHPIFCIGETRQDREEGRHFEVVKEQLSMGLFHLDNTHFKRCIIAYEPVWAIGTGLTASPGQVQEMHHTIRTMIAGKYGTETAAGTSILYGGSCNENNAPELFQLQDVDGGLIGGASLKAGSFYGVISSMS